MTDLTILRNAGVIEILLYLLDYPGGRRKIDIRTDLEMNPATATKAHRILSQEGFLVGMAYQNATAYALTPVGKKFAQALRDAETVLLKLQKKMEPPMNSMTFNLIQKNYDIGTDKPESDD